MKLVERLGNWFFAQSFEIRALIAALLFFCIPSLMSAFEERRPIAAFAETYVAYLLKYGTMGLAIWGGVAVGNRASARWHSLAAGWLIGIAAFIVFGLIAQLVIHEIPGVGWRIEQMRSSGDY